MSPALEALALRARACSRWRWMPGMRAMKEGRGSRVVEDQQGRLYLPVGPAAWQSECLPDLSDAATLGCLLALVREAHNKSSAVPLFSTDGWIVSAWTFDGRIYIGRYGQSEIEALTSALENAP